MEKKSRLTHLAITRPVSVIMALLAVLVVGVIAYLKITVELFPAGFTPPFLFVQVPYLNSNPYETEEKIARPVEESLQTVRGIQDILSTSNANGASVFVSFRQNADMNLAYNQVRDRMERVIPDLPSDVERYYVRKFNNQDEPIVFFGVSLEKTFDDPYFLIDTHVKKVLERIDGVANVDVMGLAEKLVLIDLDQEKIRALRVNIYPTIQSMMQDNFAIPSGYLTEGGKKIYVRSLGKFSSLDEIRNLQVRGTGILLKDIATVRYDVPEQKWIQRIDRKKAVRIGVFKESMANTLDLSREIVRVLDDDIRTNPALRGMNFTLFFDQGTYIQNAILNLEDAGFWGGLFAFLILLFFLRRFRMTLLITLAIPLSIIITVVALYFIGWSLNLITLMGMMICVGLVIDNSIVVVENIYRRRLLGDSPRSAAETGASEVSTAIITATMTTVVVFLPLILMNDSSGLSFYLLRIGLPIIIALISSLVVALVFIPLVANRLPIKGQIAEAKILSSGRNLYERLLTWTLHHRLDAVIIGLVILASIQFPVKYMEKTDTAEGNISDFRLHVEMPDNYSLEKADRTMTALEDFLFANREKYKIHTVDTRFSRSSGTIRAYMDSFNNNAWWYVFFQNVLHSLGLPSDKPLDRDDVINDIKATAPRFPGVKVRTRWWHESQDDKSVSVYVYGPDTNTLTPLAKEVERRLITLPEFINVETDLEKTSNEVHIIIDRVLAKKYGVSPQEIAGTVSYVVRGVNLPDFRTEDKEVDVRIQLEKRDRETLHQLKDIMITTASGKELPLATFVTFRIEKGLGTINRTNGRTYLSVKGYTPEDNIKPLYGKIDEVLAGFELPRGYTWDKGERFNRWMQQDAAEAFAMILAVVFVFLLMGVLFESFLLPLSIIVCVPFSFFGAFWVLYLTRTPFDIMAGIGLIILIGVVVNNAIVLVDLVNRFRNEGMSRHDALIEAGKHRYRPILMTAFTTIFGLIPMALGNSSLIGIPYAPMGRTIMGGIFTSTFFTLIFVPLAYTYFDDFRTSMQGFTQKIILRFRG